MGRVIEPEFGFISGDTVRELDLKSRQALSAVRKRVRVKNKHNAQEGLAGIISEEEVDEVRDILGIREVSAGDIMLMLDDSTPFFINQTMFNNLYEVLTQ